VTVVVWMLGNTLGQAAAPRLASLYVAGDVRAFRVLGFKLAGMGAVLGCLGVLTAAVGGSRF